MVTLDEQLAGTKIDLLKIDAEGYEPHIISGASHIIRNSPNLILMIEWFPSMIIAQGKQPIQFLRELKELGFTYIWKVSPHINRHGNLSPIHDNELLKQRHCDIILTRTRGNPLRV